MSRPDDTVETRILVSRFVELANSRLALTLHGDASALNRHHLNSPRTQKLGMALSGFAESIHRGRVQIFGNSERSYLARLDHEETKSAFERLDRTNISCILVTAHRDPGDQLTGFAELHAIPLLSTQLPSSEATAIVTETLSAALAPSITIHGVMLVVFGVGVLILGESGIGKSECALDLITGGHRLVSDDAVTVKRIGDDLYAEAPDVVRDFLEIRGLGIINVRELFGVSSIAPSVKVELCIEFTGVESGGVQDRLGLDESSLKLLGIALKRFPIPVTPGRNLATLVEAAVRVFVSRNSGQKATEEMIARHERAMAAAKNT